MFVEKLIKSTYRISTIGLFMATFFVFFSEIATAQSYPVPFDAFISPESFGCKHLLVPGSEILPRNPVFDSEVHGWKNVSMHSSRDKTIETLIIKGSQIVRKTKNGKPFGDPLIYIPAGGLVYDATPLKAHLPVGDIGVIFGKRAVLVKKNVQEESCHNFSVLAGRSFPVGDSIITYLMPGPKGGPLVTWRTLDGVSVRPHPLDEYPVGHVPSKTSTRIFGVYTHAGQIAEYVSFSAPIIVDELWKINGEKKAIKANSEMFKYFRAVPISCPIGHHIGFMVYNDKPVVIDTSKSGIKLYDGYLKIKILKIEASSGKVLYSINGKKYKNKNGIDSVIGRGRVVAGIKNTLNFYHNISVKKTKADSI